MNTEKRINDLLDKAKSFKDLSIPERLSSLGRDDETLISLLSVINEHLDVNEITEFFAICGHEIAPKDLNIFIENSIIYSLLTPRMIEGTYTPFYRVGDKVKQHIEKTINLYDNEKYQESADIFYSQVFISALRDFYQEFGTEQLSDDELLDEVLLPDGLIDFGAHHSQSAFFHDWIVAKAYYWQYHLFALGKYEEAFHLTNSIVFTIARKGKKSIAKQMLLRNISVLSGKNKTISLINYATVLREDHDFRSALRIYRRTILPSIFQRSTHQLTAILSEMSNIHRDNKRIFRALLFQHKAKFIRVITREKRGVAICNNQLSILYRTYRIFGISLWLSKAAEKYWRSIGDEVNLAKTVLTQGNIFNHMKKPQKALSCFNESEALNRSMRIFGELASAISGKARAMLQIKEYEKAKDYLDEAISLRERYQDRSVGIEYENMGQLLEIQGKYALALGWYKKALPYFEKYQPSYVANCNNKIKLMNKRLK